MVSFGVSKLPQCLFGNFCYLKRGNFFEKKKKKKKKIVGNTENEAVAKKMKELKN